MEVPSIFDGRKTYAQIQAEFDKALAWYGSSVPRAFKRRFAKYQTNINLLVEAFDAGEIEKLLQSVSPEELINSLVESTELIAIYKGLSPIIGQEKSLTRLIREIVDGPEFAREEDPSHSTNDARNFAFQMLIAAYCAASGFNIDLEDVADLAINDGGNEIFIEAKRPTTYRNVASNVNKALKQLGTRYDASQKLGKKRGFISLSISKLINHTQELLIAENKDGLKRLLKEIIEKFTRQNEHLWQKATVDIRTIGVIVHFNTAAYLLDEKIILPCQLIGLNNMTIANHIIGSSDHNYFMEIGYRLRGGVRALHGQ